MKMPQKFKIGDRVRVKKRGKGVNPVVVDMFGDSIGIIRGISKKYKTGDYIVDFWSDFHSKQIRAYMKAGDLVKVRGRM